MFYWLLIAIFGILAFINNYTISYGTNTSYKIGSKLSGKKIYISIVTAFMIIFLGFRGINVGIDTAMYSRLYGYAKESISFSSFCNSWHHKEIEFGFSALEFLVSRYFDFNIFLTIVAIITLIPIMKIIYKYSNNYWESIFFMVAFGYYSFFMSGIRQGIAIGLCFIAYEYALRRKLFKFILWMIIAIFFHKSAVVFLPVYWLVEIRVTSKIKLLYVVMLICSFMFSRQIFNVLNMFSRQTYSVVEGSGGYRLYIFMLFTLLLGIIYKENFIKGNNKVIYIMFAISLLIWPVTSANASVFRLYYYYNIFLILYIPNMLSSIKNKSMQVLLKSGLILVGGYNLINYVINSNMMYSPYYLLNKMI